MAKRGVYKTVTIADAKTSVRKFRAAKKKAARDARSGKARDAKAQMRSGDASKKPAAGY